MFKLKYLRHPLRTTRAAKGLLVAHLEMCRIAKQGERRFRGDKRYNPSAITKGFSSRIDNAYDDSALLERICTAYRRSVEQQKSAQSVYSATEWWQEVRQRSLGPVMNALLARDLTALRAMYRNFFRDPCSTGLLRVPYGISRAYSDKTVRTVHQRYYLAEVLHRIEYWKAQTSGQFALRVLAGARVGNPFGAMIEDTLIETGAPYRHYCAHKIRKLLSSDVDTVVEIGGGFGGVGYYLLRDTHGTRYVDFDVPESVALASYYLMSAFPALTFLLYGEEELTHQTIMQADVVLLPLFALTQVPAQLAAVSFSSHSMSDMSQGTFVEYMNQIARMTSHYFLYIGIERNTESATSSTSEHQAHFSLLEKRPLDWHGYRNSSAMELEFLYRVEGVGTEQYRCLPALASQVAICS